MSEYHTLNCTFKVEHEDSLIQALKSLGYNPKIYDQPAKLFGFQGDEREQTAHIVIPRKQVGSASNDIGFLRQDDGTYMMHVSSFDNRKWNSKLPDLIKNYTTSVVNKIVNNGPYQCVSQSTDENGVTTIRLVVRDG